MSAIEFGTCDICKGESHLSRKYYRYNIQCDCCNKKEDTHFEIVRFCTNCGPMPPRRITVVLEPISEILYSGTIGHGTTSSGLDTICPTSTTISTGYYTDNYNSFYLDENGVKQFS